MENLPKLVVVALVFVVKDDAVLLVKQNYGKRYWSLPGGMVESGESVDQAAIREVKEETGLDIRVKRVVGLYSKPSKDALAITFEGEVTSGNLKPSNEISDCRYFQFDRLPQPVRDHLRDRINDFRRKLSYAVFRTQ
jgi:8-oxo-dGTP diphosphatase